MVTYGKKGDLNSRRLAAAIIRDVWADEANRVTALKKLFDDERLRKEMGRNARIYAEQMFSVEEVVKEHLSVYKKLIL